MLVLSRKKEEVLYIGDDIRIVIVDLSSTVARIGIEAPRNVKILREELIDATSKIHQPKCPPDMEAK
jgi:carbon storage regulator